MSVSNLYPGCENVNVRRRSMMFEPSLAKGVLAVFSPMHSAQSTVDDQSTKAIDIQNISINGKVLILNILKHIKSGSSFTFLTTHLFHIISFSESP